MGIYYDKAIPSGQSTYYGITDKEFQGDLSGKGWEGDFAYHSLREMIKEKVGMRPVTVPDIFREVTGKMGLSYYDTTELVKGAVKAGYLERTRIK